MQIESKCYANNHMQIQVLLWGTFWAFFNRYFWITVVEFVDVEPVDMEDWVYDEVSKALTPESDCLGL